MEDKQVIEYKGKQYFLENEVKGKRFTYLTLKKRECEVGDTVKFKFYTSEGNKNLSNNTYTLSAIVSQEENKFAVLTRENFHPFVRKLDSLVHWND